MADTVVSAPGKVILHGEHSVVYGKVAVASSLNLRCFLRASYSKDGLVTLDFPDINVHRQWSVETLQELVPKLKQDLGLGDSPCTPSEASLQTLRKFADLKPDTTVSCDLAVVTFLYMYCKIGSQRKDGSLPSLCFRVISQLPVGAGLGSSAAYSVCLSSVLLLNAGLICPHGAEQRGDADSDGESKGQGVCSQNDRLLINKWALTAEKIIHGQPSGIDNSVSTFGGAICFKNKEIIPVEKMPSIQILLTNTKVPRSTKKLVAGVREKHDKFPEVLAPVLEAMQGLAERSVRLYQDLVDKTCNNSSYSSLEELIDLNQHLLCTIGVGHDSLDAVVKTTARHGLHTKLTGAGGGGCAYTLLRPDVDAKTVENVIGELKKLDFDCWETSVGAPGISFHPDPHKDLSVPPQLFQ